MKQNLVENNEPKSGRLAVALYPSCLAQEKGAANAYYARVVNRRKLDIGDIATDVVSDGSPFSKGQIEELWNSMANAILMRLSSGVSVDMGLGILYPSVSGCFKADGTSYDGSRNTASIRYRENALAKETMGKLSLVVTQGNKSAPQLLRIKDHVSKWDSLSPKQMADGNGKAPGTLTAGGFFTIEGKGLAIEGDDGKVGIYFDPVDGSGKPCTVGKDDLLRNETNCLCGFVPSDMKEGLYKVRIVTQYSRGKKPLAATREGSFPCDISVTTV